MFICISLTVCSVKWQNNKSGVCERMCKHWSCTKNKRKNLIKAVRINFSNFGIDEECIRLNTSSSVRLTFEITNIQVVI